MRDGDRERQRLRPGLGAEVLRDAAADLRQRLGQAPEPAVLARAALHLPVGMIDVLDAAGIVGAAALDVRARVLGDVHIGPGRRNAEMTRTREASPRGDALAGLVEIREALAAATPDNGQVVARDDLETRHGGL